MNPPSNFSSRDVLWALSNRDILRLRHWSLPAAEGTSPLSESASMERNGKIVRRILFFFVSVLGQETTFSTAKMFFLTKHFIPFLDVSENDPAGGGKF